MPNWCENILTITGPQETLSRFRKENRGKANGREESELLFSKVAPIPDSLAETVSPHRKRSLDETLLALVGKRQPLDWFEWCVSNWGTKWEPNCQPDVEESDGELVYNLDTAWSPPLPWMEKASKQYPDLEFSIKYGDPSMDFSGAMTVKGGYVTNEASGGYFEFMNCWMCRKDECKNPNCGDEDEGDSACEQEPTSTSETEMT